MKGYDGPSYFRYSEPNKENQTEEAKPLFTNSLFQRKKTSSDGVKKFSTGYEAIQEKRTSAPYRSHTVPSSYFRSNKYRQRPSTDYGQLKKQLQKSDQEFLLFEEFLSNKGQLLFIEETVEEEERTLDPSKKKKTNNQKRQLPSNRRLQQSLAGIMEAEEASEKRRKNMNSLFSSSQKL